MNPTQLSAARRNEQNKAARKRRGYRKVRPGEAAFDMIAANKAVGRWICDSEDHNAPKGCSNPDCFKYNKASRKRRERKPTCSDYIDYCLTEQAKLKGVQLPLLDRFPHLAYETKDGCKLCDRHLDLARVTEPVTLTGRSFPVEQCSVCQEEM